ncbi:MAG: hypothetical protein DRO06_02700, partial [Thermoproteota archaeon]
ACGGVTTLVDMPLVLTTLTDLARRKIEAGERDSVVDFSLHAGMMEREEHLEEVEALAEMGVRSFKAFTTAPFRATYEYIGRLLARAGSVGGRVTVHAEDHDVVEEGVRKIRGEGRKDPLAHHESRPPEAEAVAVARLISLVERVGGHLHVAHMNTAYGVALVNEAKARGLRVTAETCLHYLVYTKEAARERGPYLKMTPPLRTRGDVEALWRGVEAGVVDAVATDHAPGTREEKEVGWEDIWEAWGGIPGVEELLPLTVSEGLRRGIPLERLCWVLSEGPARAFGLYPRKGALLPGSDADLVLLERREVTIRADALHYKVGWSAYEGLRSSVWPSATYVRGTLVAREGEVLARPGHGRFVPMGGDPAVPVWRLGG